MHIQYNSDWYKFIVQSKLTVAEVESLHNFIRENGENPNSLSTAEIQKHWDNYISSGTLNMMQ